MSGIINMVKDAITGESHSNTAETSNTTTGTHSSTAGTSEGVAGPHSSRVANAADPRVDSDLDSSRNAGAHSTTQSTGLTGAGNTSDNTDYTGSTYTTSSGSTITDSGPTHSSNFANKLDPRVDTNTTTGTTGGTYGSSTHGAHTGTAGTHASGTHGVHTGTHEAHTGTHGIHTGTTGTHGSGIHGSHTSTTGAYPTTGTTGGLSSSTNAGPHDSNFANKVDPRVDSDLDGRGNRHGATASHGLTGASGSHATAGSGTAQNTAGPHNSDTANKLDPRVDSDLDGSKTLGGNRTHATRESIDASSALPSVMREHLGEPEILHSDKQHNRAKRHGSLSQNGPLSYQSAQSGI